MTLRNGALVRQRLISAIGFPALGPLRPRIGTPSLALTAALLSVVLAALFASSAVAATCTDNFIGPNEGQWSDASNWSAGIPSSTSVACWPSNITVLITSPVNGYGGNPGSIQGGGLTIGEEDALYFGNAAGVSTLSGKLTQTELGYIRGPQTLEISGPIEWASGQIAEKVAVIQSAGSNLLIGPGNTQAYLDPGSSINTGSPVTISNPDFLTAGTSLTTSSTITLASGLSLFTEGGDDGTFTAAGIGPNSGPTYGFGADTLILTGGTTTVPSGQTLESGPLSVQGGVLQDDGTVGESTYSGSTELASTKLTGGTLDGTGTVAGALTNSSGTLAPGDAPGQLKVAGNYTQESSGTLAIGISGPTPGTEFDQLLVGGNALLAGTLSVTDEGGYEPPLGQTFKIISGASTRSGSFSSVGGPSAGIYGVSYEPDGVTLTTNVAPNPKSKSSTETNSNSPTTTSTTTTTTTTSTTTTGIASSAKAIEELQLGCNGSPLVLNDVYIQGAHVEIRGSAAKSYVGKKVKILFNEGKQVATATVESNGQYTTTAPLPPAKIRDNLDTRYTAEIGKLRSLHLKLVRRLLLEPLKASGTTVTLTGQITPPLTKPIAPITVEQQLECGKTTVVKTFTPSASGHYDITVTVPVNARAAIFRLTSKVAANKHSVKHGFTTFSLPLPVAIG
jgi:hypothetical protein